MANGEQETSSRGPEGMTTDPITEDSSALDRARWHATYGDLREAVKAILEEIDAAVSPEREEGAPNAGTGVQGLPAY